MIERIGKYEILQELGRGGFATVYKAHDPELDRDVALKVLHPQLLIDPKFVKRFFYEAKTAARLTHPNIVTIYEVGTEKNFYFLAMALLSGQTLNNYILNQNVSIKEVIDIIEQIASALDVLHENGLIHRDVKPANIMVDNKGHATLLDFGIVRAVEGTRLTTTLAILGTPEYMAPEQAELIEGVDLDWRVDIYALGIVAYQMLTGRPPFIGQSPTAILYKHIHEAPPSPRSFNPDIPLELETVLFKALAKNREERYQQASEFAITLKKAVTSELLHNQTNEYLEKLYTDILIAREKEDWIEVLALGRQIQSQYQDYKDVNNLISFARKSLDNQDKHMSIPKWGWITGGIVVLTIIIGFIYTLSASDFLIRPSITLTPTQILAEEVTSTLEPTDAPPPTQTAYIKPNEVITTPIPAATPTKAPRIIQPELSSPSYGQQYKNPVDFEWSGTLSARQSYQVTVVHKNSNYILQSQLLNGTLWSVDLPAELVGEWDWRVSIIQNNQTIISSEEGMFWFNPVPGVTDNDISPLSNP